MGCDISTTVSRVITVTVSEGEVLECTLDTEPVRCECGQALCVCDMVKHNQKVTCSYCKAEYKLVWVTESVPKRAVGWYTLGESVLYSDDKGEFSIVRMRPVSETENGGFGREAFLERYNPYNVPTYIGPKEALKKILSPWFNEAKRFMEYLENGEWLSSCTASNIKRMMTNINVDVSHLPDLFDLSY